jgi:hypothetical protein
MRPEAGITLTEKPKALIGRYSMTSDMFENVRSTFRDLDRGRDLTLAASVLGGLRVGYRRNRGRKKPRRWTGYLADGSRAWFGQRVLLPNGTVGYICAVLRGQVVARWDDPKCLLGVRFGLFKTPDVQRLRHPAAVLMGKSKAGITERPSERKAAAARINGRMPTRPGRRRGRPPAKVSGSS